MSYCHYTQILRGLLVLFLLLARLTLLALPRQGVTDAVDMLDGAVQRDTGEQFRSPNKSAASISVAASGLELWHLPMT